MHPQILSQCLTIGMATAAAQLLTTFTAVALMPLLCLLLLAAVLRQLSLPGLLSSGLLPLGLALLGGRVWGQGRRG